MFQVDFTSLERKPLSTTPFEYISDNETIGVRDLPESFHVKGLGNNGHFYPVKIEQGVILYRQEHGCVEITLYRM